MRIIKLEVKNNKCLQDFVIEFNGEGLSNTTVLIGENGTGKTTIIQTILEIFLSYKKEAIEKKIDYDYSITYMLFGKVVSVTKMNADYTLIYNGHVSVGTYSWVIKKNSFGPLLPERLFFYSAYDNAKVKDFNETNGLYVRECRRVITKVLSKKEDGIDDGESYDHEEPGNSILSKKIFNYADESYISLYLMAVLCGVDEVGSRYLKAYCGINGIHHIRISITPLFLSGVRREELKNDGKRLILTMINQIDSRFRKWFENGTFSQDKIQLSVDIHEAPKVFAYANEIFDFFDKIRTVFLAEFDVYVERGKSIVLDKELSEGQKQLIKLLGTLSISKDEETLVLLDEPDAHMNPQWKYRIKTLIDDFLISVNGIQTIIATHDPLVINGVTKENIRILSYDEENEQEDFHTIVSVPFRDTKGMGIDGILLSEYFKLPSVLDRETEQLIERKNELLVKKYKRGIDSKEEEEYKELSEAIEDMYYARNIPAEPYYDEFVVAMHNYYSKKQKKVLTESEIEDRNEVAEMIIRRLVENEIH